MIDEEWITIFNLKYFKQVKMTDLDIAKTIKLKHIRTIAQKLGLNEDEITKIQRE